MPDRQEIWTVLKLINWSTEYLHSKAIENARLNVESLLCHVLRCGRVGLYLDFDRPLADDELTDFKKLLLRRASAEPLQYIIGETEFYSLRFQVRPGVLIPRPETEIVVQHALARLNKSQNAPKILDVGTGAGILAITFAKQIPDARLLAIDISEKALQVAARNSDFHHTSDRIDFVRCDILNEGNWDLLGETKFDLIVSNPPYLTLDEKNTLHPEVSKFEPPEALFVEDALQFYRVLLKLAQYKLQKSGYLICELAANRHESVKTAFTDAGMADIVVAPDLAGNMRVISGKFD
jgi:release factor glutamine methyltransferase